MVGGSDPSKDVKTGRPRVLVAEDEVPLLRAISRVLDDAGFDVHGAEDGLRAAQLLAEQTFDAVLTDVGLPGMDGIAVLRAARQRDLEVPVLLMTGAPTLESAADAVRHGACEYITKPVPMAHLAQMVRRGVDLSRIARAKREAIEMLATGQPAAGDRTGLEITLDRALASLWMAYQPIVDAKTRSVFGYEALLRSAEPALPNPGAVLDAAERLGRLNDVGRAVRLKAPEPIGAVNPPTTLFINLHARDLEDETLTSPSAPLTAIASQVVLEITERASLEEVGDARWKVARLREMGFRIAIDDLGAGYAGLTSFAQLEPEFVKLDMSLVRDVHKSPMKQKLVKSLTGLCNDMGIAVVAEGIEVVEERDAIVAIGCTLLQGYLLAKPGRAFPDVSW